MSSSLHLGAVDEMRVQLSFSRVLDGPAHDVFLLDVHPRASTDRFDEAPVLEVLEPVLYTRGPASDPYVVHVSRTHSSWAGGAGQAQIAIALATGLSTGMGPAATEVVRSTLRKVLEHVGAEKAAPLTHREAIDEARLRVERSFPEVHADRLTVTDEEHISAEGRWSVGLTLSTVARFQVDIGFVDGDSQTTHVRRMPGSEVVDSVGAGSGL